MICEGCQRWRPPGYRNKPSPKHECEGGGCICGSCNKWQPVTDEQYKTWMANLGGFYVENTKLLAKMIKERKLKVKDDA